MMQLPSAELVRWERTRTTASKNPLAVSSHPCEPRLRRPNEGQCQPLRLTEPRARGPAAAIAIPIDEDGH